ncbi:MAG: hypothetical protein KDE51_25690, partial [Anaerolineales bacterium]|nr:hypothetical protein [Anaerolineales bacterium]
GHGGGGMYVGRRLALSERSWFIHNTAALGGGLAISNTSGTAEMKVVNSLFARNQAAEQGAAVYLQSPRPLHLIHTTIADIGLNPQAAVYAVSSTVQMTNSIVASHTVGLVNVGGQITATATVYFGNGAAHEGEISEREAVVGNPRFQEPAVDDYRLGVGSVAIDNALEVGVTADILGLARPVNTLPDRGAYEGPFVYTLRIPIVFGREES